MVLAAFMQDTVHMNVRVIDPASNNLTYNVRLRVKDIAPAEASNTVSLSIVLQLFVHIKRVHR
jgi:hypothetical protein